VSFEVSVVVVVVEVDSGTRFRLIECEEVDEDDIVVVSVVVVVDDDDDDDERGTSSV
jgi:hypothetical protein